MEKGIKRKGVNLKKSNIVFLTLLAILYAFSYKMDTHAATSTCNHNTPAGYQKEILKPATCTSSQTIRTICRSCGGTVYKGPDQTDKSLGGHIVAYKTTVPSCKEPSWYITYCSRCHQELRRIEQAPKTSHSFYDVRVTRDGTCSIDEEVLQRCSCGAEQTINRGKDLNNHVNLTNKREVQKATCETVARYLVDCADCKAKNMEQLGTTKGAHDYSITVVVKPATCSEYGTAKKKCKCGAIDKNSSFAVPKDPNAHNFTSKGWKTDPTDPPTCQSAGHRLWFCEDCKVATKRVVGAKLDHAYKEVVTKQPTCATAGEKSLVCYMCGNTKGTPTVIPATGKHQFPSNDSGKALLCKTCGISYCDLKGHRFPTSYVCGEDRKVKCERIDCKATKSLSKSNMSHSYLYDVGKNEIICSGCNETMSKKDRITIEEFQKYCDSKIVGELYAKYTGDDQVIMQYYLGYEPPKDHRFVKDCSEVFITLNVLSKKVGLDDEWAEKLEIASSISTYAYYYERICYGEDLSEKADFILKLSKTAVSTNPITKIVYEKQIEAIEQPLKKVLQKYAQDNRDYLCHDVFCDGVKISSTEWVQVENFTLDKLREDGVVEYFFSEERKNDFFAEEFIMIVIGYEYSKAMGFDVPADLKTYIKENLLGQYD